MKSDLEIELESMIPLLRSGAKPEAVLGIIRRVKRISPDFEGGLEVDKLSEGERRILLREMEKKFG